MHSLSLHLTALGLTNFITILLTHVDPLFVVSGEEPGRVADVQCKVKSRESLTSSVPSHLSWMALPSWSAKVGCSHLCLP